MLILLDLASHVGTLALTTAAILSGALVVVYIWIISGSAAERSLFYLESYRRIDELGLDRVRRRDAFRASIGRSVDLSMLLRPWRSFRVDDTNWQKDLQDRYEDKRQGGEPISRFHARERDAIDQLASIVRGITPARGADPSAPSIWSPQAEASFAITTRHADASQDVAQLREGDRPSQRRALHLALTFLRDGDGTSSWRSLVLELLDFLGRGTSLGLLVAVIVSGDAPLLTRIAIGTVIGGGLALWLWQRRMVCRLAHGTLAFDHLPARTRQWVQRADRHPGLTVSAVYAAAVGAQGLVAALDRVSVLIQS